MKNRRERFLEQETARHWHWRRKDHTWRHGFAGAGRLARRTCRPRARECEKASRIPSRSRKIEALLVRNLLSQRPPCHRNLEQQLEEIAFTARGCLLRQLRLAAIERRGLEAPSQVSHEDRRRRPF